MIKKFQLLLICFLLLTELSVSFCQQSSVYVSKEIKSTLLNQSIKYSVYLPRSYSLDNKDFPCLYLLHGFGGDETSWLARCNVQSLVDSLVDNNLFPETILIMPDIKKTYCINSFDSTYMYEDFFIHEFVPYIDSVYHTIKSPDARAICGLSMGGFGAIILPFKYPDIFKYSIALSAAIRTPKEFIALPQDRYEIYFAPLFGDTLSGYNRISQHWKNNSPYFLLDSALVEKLKSINWYIDCGMQDFLFSSNKAFHELLYNYNIPHEYHMRIGAHNWEYWQKGFVEGLLFLGNNFR